MTKPQKAPEIRSELLDLLAEVDALFEPIRDWSSTRRNAAIIKARRQFHERGIPFRTAGGTGSERTAATRAADELEATKLVVFSRRRGRRTTWKLSEAEDWRLRWWTHQAEVHEMALALFAVDVVSATLEGAICPEIRLTGGRGWDGEPSEQLLGIEELLLPALVRDFVVSHSDHHGRVGYSLTDSGRKFLAGWKGETGALDETYHRRAAKAAHSRYCESLASARAELLERAHHEAVSNHIAIALSAGMWPADDVGTVVDIVDDNGLPRRFADVFPDDPLMKGHSQ